MVAADDVALLCYVDSPAQALAALKESVSEGLEAATPAFAKTTKPPVTG